MLTAPEIREPKVKPEALPGVRVPTPIMRGAPIEAFGGGEADRTVDLKAMTEEALRLYQKSQSDANELAVNDADNQLQASSTSILHDPKTGVMNLQGKNAFAAPDMVKEQYTKAVNDIQAKLSNNDQKVAFQRRAAAHWNSVNEQVQDHVSTQHKVYDEDTTKGVVANRLNDAVANYRDTEKVEQFAREAVAATIDYGKRQGLPDEAIQDQAAKTGSHVYAEVISRFLAEGHDLEASNFYEDHKKYITGTDSVSVEKALEEGTTRGEAHRQVDEIVSKPGLTMQDAMDKVAKIKDGKVRDQAREYTLQHYEDLKRSDDFARAKTFQNASDYIENSKGRKEVPPDVWAGLNAEERSSLDRRREQLIKGIDPKTDWTRYYDLMSKASDPARRAEFLSHSLLLDRADLADAQFEELTRRQSELREHDPKGEADIGHYRATAEAINNNLLGAGINPHDMADENQAKVNSFRNQVYDQIRQVEEDTGKKVKAPDVQRIIDGLLTKGIVARHWWQNDKRLFQMNPDDVLNLQIKDVPRADAAQIRAALQKRGLPATDDRVLQLYTARVQSMRPEE